MRAHARRRRTTANPPRDGPFPAAPSSFVIAAASDGMIGLDSKGRIQSWNAGARRIFGYGREEILGSPISRLLPPENRRGMARLQSRIRAHPWIEYGEASCVRKGARPVEVAFTAVPERSLAPDRDGILLIVHDITARKQLERALRETLRRHESAEQLARMGSWEWDVSADTLTWSEEFYHLLALPRSLQRSSLKRFSRRILPGDRKKFLAGIRKTVKERVPFECRYGLCRADGSTLDVVSRGRLIRGPGSRVRLVGVTQDLRRSPERHADIFRTHTRRARGIQTHALLLTRAATLLLSTFDAEEALLKTLKAAVPGLADRCILDLVEEDRSVVRLKSMAVRAGRLGGQPGWVQREKLPSFPGGAPARVLGTGDYELHQGLPSKELASLFPDLDALSLRPGAEPSSALFLPLHSRRGVTGVVTLVQSESRRRFAAPDLQTAQRLAQLMSLALERCRLHADLVRKMEALRGKEGELVALNRGLDDRVRRRTAELGESLKDMESFARTVAHDLRAPLRGISGLAQALVEDLGDRLGPQARDLASRIRQGCSRMDTLIRDVLSYSGSSPPKMDLEPVDLAAVVEGARRQLEPDLAARRARIVLEPPLPRVLAHPSLLLQAIVNLLDNATKFVAPGTIPSLRVAAEPRQKRVRLFIEDNGIGIPPEYADRIFKPFERLHSSQAYPGTGLGLAIVRRCVERMGGTVGVESPVGGGSRFWIELPEAPAGADPTLSRATNV